VSEIVLGAEGTEVYEADTVLVFEVPTTLFHFTKSFVGSLMALI
jgi:hypothetical protein